MKKKKLSIFIKLFCTLTAVFSLAGCDFFDSESGSKEIEINPIYNEEGLIKVPDSSEHFYDKDYKDAIKEFQKAGFSNFKIKFLNDTFFGLFVTVDAIDSIQINDLNEFDNDTFVDQKCVVCMDVHSTSGGFKMITKEIDGQLPIMYSSSDLKGIDKLKAGEDVCDLGFKNVSYIPIQDCYSDWDWELNDTESIQVDGSYNYSFYTYVDVTTPIKISYHTVSGDYCTNGLTHKLISDDYVAPTCTSSGWTSGSHCSVCDRSFNGRQEIPALGHSKVVDIEAVEATCISKGKTEGSHCSRCNEILSKSIELPIDLNNHADLIIEEQIDATCISEGITEGRHCEACHSNLMTPVIIPINADNHVRTTLIEGTKATCQSTGISDGLYCEDCKKTVVEQTETPKDPNNHTNIVIDPAVTATETSNGKTEGKHCGDCGAVIIAQTSTTWVPSTEWILTHKANESQLKKYYDANKGKQYYVYCRLYDWDLWSSYYSMKFCSSTTVGTIFYAKAVDCSKVKNTSALNQSRPPVGITITLTGYEAALNYIYINVISISFY